MLRPSFAVLSARAHRPLISFIGKRAPPSLLAPAHPHPAAPPEHRKAFSGDLPKTHNTTGTVAQPSFRDFWDAPTRFWQPKHHKLEDSEIDAIQSGGATLH